MKYFLIAVLWLASVWAQDSRPCVFCEIVSGKREVSVVFRNEKVIAFLDHAPINSGHTLIIPVGHFENLTDTPVEVAKEMMEVAQRIGTSFQKAGIKAEAFQLHMNNGRMVQNVRHAHLHVYPRFQKDFPGDSVIRLASQRVQVERKELDAIAAKLRKTLELNEVFAAYYEEALKLEPWRATTAGDPRYNDQFPNTLSHEYREQKRAFLRKYVDKVKVFDRETLTSVEQVNYDTLVWDGEMELALLEFPTELLPVNQFSGMHLSVAIWAGGTSAQPFKTVRDYENWLKRLDGFAEWCDSAVARMKEGVAKGYALPKTLTEKAAPQLAKMTEGPAEKHPFYAPILNMPEEIKGADRERLAKTYAQKIQEKIIPAYAKLHSYLASDYLKASRASSGISAIPRGKEFYDLKVREYTTSDMTAEEVHELGLKEVKRIQAEMEDVKKQVGFTGTLKEFFEHVRARKELMPFDDPQKVIEHFNSIHARMEPYLDKLFDVTPKTKFEVRRTEAFREKSAAAQYASGSLDGTRPGIFYVPIPEVKEYNVFRDEALFLHEAIPGHHYQLSLQREEALLPQFRRTGGHSVFVEGWALYCESLGKELGLYKDPYQYFGMLSMEIHRAIRLVVDTGLHAKGWTREQAISYSLENEAASEASVVAEIERYMAIPGQALSYKVGQLKMLELRARAEKELGKKFNIREFHRQILETGSVPLKVLEQKIDHWIAEKKM